MSKPQQNDEHQPLLLESADWWEQNWKREEEPTPQRALYVHFETDADVAAFAALIEQHIDKSTQQLWYPARESKTLWVEFTLTEATRYIVEQSQADQLALCDLDEAWEEHWHGMPEFVQHDLMPLRTITVLFLSQSDVDKFGKLIKQKITANQKFLWHPEAELASVATKAYVNSSASVKRSQ